MRLVLYILRRLVLMVPTLIGITVITFAAVNLAPGGPLEQKIQQIRQGNGGKGGRSLQTRGEAGISPEVLEAMKKQYGLDKPLPTRYFIWLKNIVHLDFGKSFDYQQPVIDVIVSRFPVSVQFGLISFVLTYSISVGLGIFMAYKAHGFADSSLSFLLIVASAIPAFAFGVLLIVFFAGGSFLDWFPMGYLTSENYESMSLSAKIIDRIHHFILPLLAYMIGSFTTLAFLTRNSVLGEVNKDYIRTARAIGLSKWKVYMRHALRNAMIPIVTGIGGFLGLFLTGSMLIETIFQLNGVGLLGYQALMSRDYNMILGLTFLQSLALLAGNLVGDLAYMMVDPRIDLTRA